MRADDYTGAVETKTVETIGMWNSIPAERDSVVSTDGCWLGAPRLRAPTDEIFQSP